MIAYTTWIEANAATANERTAEAARHAADTAQVIADKPLSIVFRKPNGTDTVAQTVRIDSDSNVSEGESAAGAAPKRKVILTAAANADIKEGYRFNLDNDSYRVVDIIAATIGELQVVAESSG